ncbi:MAG TPA: LssY C-terminal domain-containing protein [Steroidobacteraceae bacterium]|nr:LssY C-terminal domain-containing protein [Steroidobacteraceae bacterium]
MIGATSRLGLLALLMLALAGCATSNFAPERLATPDQLRDVRSKSIGDVSVSVSILTDAQSRQHFGVDFAQHNLQALWMSVRNGSDRRLWFIRNMLDPDFYSAEEAALLVQGDVSRDARQQLHQFFRDESIRAQLAPRTVTEGFMFLPRVEGGRYVDIRLQGDAYQEDSQKRDATASTVASAARTPRELRFDFALPLPDGDFDYESLDTSRTYSGIALPNLTAAELRSTLEQLPCCAMDADGQQDGDPLNFVIVGEAAEVLNSLSRSGWSFTHRIDLRTIRREVGAAIAGTAYPVAPVSSLYVFGRKQDVALQRARRSIAQRNHLRLWLAPYRFENRPVWIGQISRDIGVKVTPKSPTLTTHIIDPQVDATREYLLHSLIAEGFVDRFGFVKGSAAGTPSQPRFNLTGDPYHSDGMRLVVILSTEPVPPDQIQSLLWEQSAAPIAEGQSEAAERNVRPID